MGQHLCRTHSRCSGKARHRGNSRASQFSENSGYTFRASSEHGITGVCSSSAEFHCQTATSRHRCCHYLTLRAKLDAPDKKKSHFEGVLHETAGAGKNPENFVLFRSWLASSSSCCRLRLRADALYTSSKNREQRRMKTSRWDVSLCSETGQNMLRQMRRQD